MKVCVIMVCIQCALKDILEGRTPSWIAEKPEEHMAKMHPDPVETFRERQVLEKKLRERWEGR